MIRYFLKGCWQEEFQEVIKRQFIEAEKARGFQSKIPGEAATGGFCGNGISGKIEMGGTNGLPT